MKQVILNLLQEKWNIGNDQSNANYEVRREIIYKQGVLKFSVCDYNDN